MSASLVANAVTFAYGRSPIVEDVTLTVDAGHRWAMVGPNGAGKTTLLRLLAGELRPDRGSVQTRPPRASVGLLGQEPERPRHEKASDLVARRTGVAGANTELTLATDALADGADDPAAAERYDTALTRWLALGCAEFEARLGQVAEQLALEPGVFARPVDCLSGGEAAKVSLAALLMARFDVLLLDEPTNDLDAVGLERLESYLMTDPRPMAIVSHDRAFCERVITDVAELDPHTRHVTTFSGGWHAYRAERQRVADRARMAFGEYEDARRELSDRIARQRDWAARGERAARRNPADNDRNRYRYDLDGADSQIVRAGKVRRRLDRLEVVDKPWEPWRLEFDIGVTERAGDVVARLSGVVVDHGTFNLGPVDLLIEWGDRIAITGPNGAGKSTLLAVLLGRATPSEGSAWLGPGVVVGEIEQVRAQLDAAPTLLRAVMDLTGLTVPDARTLLAKFGLVASHVDRPACSLSPGERTRGVLALLQARGVNCVVLDEPTNHLDLEAIEQLEQALERFAGTVVLVTHDRRLLESVRLTRRIAVVAGRLEE